MTRRSLFRLFGGTAAAYVNPFTVPPVAAAPVVSAPVNVLHTTFNPVNYIGEYRWINVTPMPAAIGAFRGKLGQSSDSSP